MGGKSKSEDEANERRAREKLLARRNLARSAASSATQTAQQTNEVINDETHDEKTSSKGLLKTAGTALDRKSCDAAKGQKADNALIRSSVPTDTKKENKSTVNGPDTSTSSTNRESTGKKQRSGRRRRARARERERKRLKRMSNRSAVSAAAAPGGPRERERVPPHLGSGGRYSPPPPYHRDEFGRGLPPPRRDGYDCPPPPGGPGYYNGHRGPPPPRHRECGGPPPPYHRDGRGIPPGPWERDRGMKALPPHPRSLRRGRSRSPPPHLSSRDRHHRGHHLHPDDRQHYNRNRRDEDVRRSRENRHRSRRGRSHSSGSSRSYPSRSRSRSISSRGSSSSFSSSQNGSRRSGARSYHSDDSRSRSSSRSRSRSYSRSRSPLPHSSGENGKHGKSDDPDDQEKRNDGSEKKEKDGIIETEKIEKEKEDQAGSPSSRGSRSSQKHIERTEKRSRSRSTSRGSHGRSRGRERERKRKSNRKGDRSSGSRSSRSMSQSRSPVSSVSRSHSPASLSYSTTSSRHSRDRRRGRRSKRRRKKQHRGSSSRGDKHPEDGLTKDQRTIFVSQLVMRTTERDLKRYFKKKVGCKVNDVILLRDRRNARNHKGCAYVEVGRIEDVAKAVGVSGQPPDFQRFPILVKASEAEKNYTNPLSGASTAINGTADTEGLGGSSPSAIAVTPTNNGYANTMSASQEKPTKTTRPSFLPPLRDENGRLIESQKIYVGGLDPSVREDHLHALFGQFGNLLKVQLQYHPNTQISRGFAFLTFRDPKVSHLAIRTMAGKIVAGRPMKTGWANQHQQSSASIASGCTIVTSDQFPENASDLVQKALSALAQMTGGTTAAIQQQQLVDFATSGPNSTATVTMAEQELDKAMGLIGSGTVAQTIPTVAEARASMAAGGTGAMGATVAEARASLAADVAARQLAAATSAAAVAAAAETRVAASKLAFIGNAGNGPTLHLLVHNMYDKDEETEVGWENDIKEEFLDECSKFGKIEHVKVMHKEPGGKIYATFSDREGAKNCAENLAGRWFDKRQLRVDYMNEANPP
mmetsp:Transcript_11283/g.27096  ORF Transcript_11283/g.27096 Transcript_11283/m.27096 type:complete len:1039 (-) Transcript_11283:2809-5925(-)